MRSGMKLPELAAEIKRQAETKIDYKAHDKHLHVGVGTGNGMLLTIGDKAEVYVRPTMHQQFAEKLRIPKVYYDRMLVETPELLAVNVNEWLDRSDKTHMVRTMDGCARAFLGDSFRTLDNFDLIVPALRAFETHGVEVVSAGITDERLYIQALSRTLKADLKVGDTVEAGIIIGNSEVGMGKLYIKTLLRNLICLNGMVRQTALGQAHIGGSRTQGLVEGAEVYYSDKTKQLSDAAFFSKFSDTVKGVLSEEHFQKQIAALDEASERKIQGDPVVAVEVVQQRVGLTDTEAGAMLRHLIEGKDLSQWGVANAVTRLAHDTEDYNRMVDLETAGGKVIELPRAQWEEVANAA